MFVYANANYLSSTELFYVKNDNQITLDTSECIFLE